MRLGGEHNARRRPLSHPGNVAPAAAGRLADPGPLPASLLAELRRRARSEPADSGFPAWLPALTGAVRSQRGPRGRGLGQHGRRTVGKLLDAGLAELADKGYQALRADDVVRRASTSHAPSTSTSPVRKICSARWWETCYGTCG
jgi:hypothetical protein